MGNWSIFWRVALIGATAYYGWWAGGWSGIFYALIGLGFLLFIFYAIYDLLRWVFGSHGQQQPSNIYYLHVDHLDRLEIPEHPVIEHPDPTRPRD